MAGASGATLRSLTLADSVADSARSVITPTMPTLRPAASTSTDGLTFGQLTGCFVAASSRFAARNGNRASAARAFSAPRASSDGSRGITEGPTGPKSNSWLPTAAAVYPSALYADDDDRAFGQVRLERALEHVAGVDEQHGPIAGARGSQVADIAAEQRQPATPIAGHDAAVQVVGANDGESDGACGGRGSRGPCGLGRRTAGTAGREDGQQR